MSMESTPNEEAFLLPREFVENILGKLGVASAIELEPRDKARIAMAFHMDQVEHAFASQIRELGLDQKQTRQVFGLICSSSARMRVVLEILVGHERGQDLDDINF